MQNGGIRSVPFWIFRLWKNDKPVLFAVVFCTAVVIYLGSLVFHRERWVDTQNARVDGEYTVIGAPVEGIVRRVRVESQQHVKRGQILCEIDDREYRNAMTLAEQNQEMIGAALESARKDRNRSRKLFKDGAISASQYDQARYHFNAVREQWVAAKDAVRLARVKLDHTRVTALRDGIVAGRAAQPGMMVKKKEPLFGIVYPRRKWVEAKVRESDLPDLRLGEPTRITLDAIPGHTFRGKIVSLSPTTENRFSAVPADPAAGNFTKYVQWVPIRVAFENPGSRDWNRIRIGLSAEVRIRRRR